MKHRQIIITLSLLLFIVLATSAGFCSRDNNLPTMEITRFDDGSYATIETVTDIPSIALFSAKTRTASTTYTYYESDNSKQWAFTVTGTFNYDGTTATATAVSSTYSIYNNKWGVSSRSNSKSGAKVTSTYQFKYGTTFKSATIGLKCSANGTISTI